MGNYHETIRKKKDNILDHYYLHVIINQFIIHPQFFLYYMEKCNLIGFREIHSFEIYDF